MIHRSLVFCLAALFLLEASVQAQSRAPFSSAFRRSGSMATSTGSVSSSAHSGHRHGSGHHGRGRSGGYCYDDRFFPGFFPGVYSYGFVGPFGYSSVYTSNTFIAPYGTSFTYGTMAYGPALNDPWVTPYYTGFNGYTTFATPGSGDADLLLNPLNEIQQQEEWRRQQQLNINANNLQVPADKLAPIPVQPSSAAGKLRSRQDQMRGDQYFRDLKLSLAVSSYRQAAAHAQDLAEPQFRLSVSYAALGQFDRAVTALKRTLDLDPAFPHRGFGIAELYGEDNAIARESMLSRLTKWVEQDIRDPDRLLLIGALLYQDSRDQAVVFLETSGQLAERNHYVIPFLIRDDRLAVAPAEEKQPVTPKIVAPGDPSPHVIVPQKKPAAIDPDDAPPLPMPEKPPTPGPEADVPFQPSDLGFILPRHGRPLPAPQQSQAEPEGPRFPVLAN